MQVVPHITDAIQEWIERVAMIPVDGKEGPADVCVIELGGTIGTTRKSTFIFIYLFIYIYFDQVFLIMLNEILVLAGDIESMPFIEALGQFSYRVGKNTFYHNSLYTKGSILRVFSASKSTLVTTLYIQRVYLIMLSAPKDLWF